MKLFKKSVLFAVATVAITFPTLLYLFIVAGFQWAGLIFIFVHLPYGMIREGLFIYGGIPTSSLLSSVLGLLGDLLFWVVMWYFYLSERQLYKESQMGNRGSDIVFDRKEQN